MLVLNSYLLDSSLGRDTKGERPTAPPFTSAPPLLRVDQESPARSPLLSGGAASRRGRECTARAMQSSSRASCRFPLVWSGSMPSLSLSWVLPSCSWGVSLVLLLLQALRWSEIEAARVSKATTLLNKLVLWPNLFHRFGLSFSCLCRSSWWRRWSGRRGDRHYDLEFIIDGASSA